MISRPLPILSRSSSFYHSPVFWLFCAAFIVRLLIAGRLADSPRFLPDGDDSKYYSDWALRIASGAWTDGKAFYGLPGYPYFLALIYGLFGFNPFIVAVLQALVEACTAAVIFLIGATLFSPKRECHLKDESAVGYWTGLLAAIAWIAFLPAQAYSVILMPTAWLILAYWGILLWAVRADLRSSAHPWFGMGVLLGVVSMMIATIFFLIPLVIIALLRKTAPEPASVPPAGRLRAAAASALFLIGVVLGSSPATLHNYLIAREPVFMSAHSGINFWIGNSPTATGYPAMPKGMRASQEELFEDSISFAEKEAGRPLSRAEVSQHWNQKAKTWIRENPERWRQLLWTKFLNFWNAYQYDDLSIVSMLREFGVLPPGLRFGVVAALGIPGMLAALLWAPPRARFVIGAILLHMAALLPVFITERYRMCAVPGLLLCGAFGLCCLWQHLVNRKWMPAAVQCAFLSGAIWFVTLPRGDAAGWSLDDYNTAIRALDAERLDVAEKKLKIVYAYTPESAEVFFALGNLWLARGQRDRAKYQYRRALEIEPGHPEAWNNLGVLALEEKRHALAAQFLENAVRLEPNDAKTHYLLAKAYANLGQLAAAKRAIAEALSRRPNQQEFIDLGREIEAASAKQGGH